MELTEPVNYREIFDTIVIARSLIQNPRSWTTGVSAKNSFGEPASPEAMEAVQFCALGACDRAYYRHHSQLADNGSHSNTFSYITNFCHEHFKKDITKVNDHDGHAAVLKAFDMMLADLDLKIKV